MNSLLAAFATSHEQDPNEQELTTDKSELLQETMSDVPQAIETVLDGLVDAAAANPAILDDEQVSDLPDVDDNVVQKLNFSNEDEVTDNTDNIIVENNNIVENSVNSQISEVEDQGLSIVDGNLGVLSDFSGKSSASTPIGGEIEGLMDEVQACMLSVSNLEHMHTAATDYQIREQLPDREDLPIILKRIVENCETKDHKGRDILYSSLCGLACYISHVTDNTHILRHSQSELTAWFKSLLRLPDYTPYLYKDDTAAILQLITSLLHSHYPTMQEEGLFALYSRCPVIYMTAEYTNRYTASILSNLHLPNSTISILPATSTSPNSRTIDIRALERLIQDDIVCGKLPLLVLTTIGTEVTGHMDNIPAIKQLCDEYGVWVHAAGSCTPLLSLSTRPDSLSVFSLCDSILVSCDSLIPDLSCDTACLCVQDSRGQLTHQADLEVLLPMWVIVQEQGLTDIRENLERSYNVSLELYNQLKQLACIQILEYPLTGHVLCFRYYTQLDTIPDLSEDPPMNRLMSRLTKLLLEALTREVGEDYFQHVAFSEDTDVIRIPAMTTELTLEHVEHITYLIQEQTGIFENTLRQRQEFNYEIQSRECFLLVNDPEHPSLGSIQYLPKYLQDEEACSTPEGTEELNDVNMALADYLCSKDWAFLSVRQVGHFTVLTVPLISESLDIRGFLDDIVTAAPKFENNSKYLAKMSEVIRRGIEKANEELAQETEQQFYEKGIMRQIPLFGPVFNWMSPIEEKKIVGRSFSIHSGEIQTSNSVYNSVLGSPATNRSRTVSSSSQISEPQGSERGFPKVNIEQ